MTLKTKNGIQLFLVGDSYYTVDEQVKDEIEQLEPAVQWSDAHDCYFIYKIYIQGGNMIITFDYSNDFEKFEAEVNVI